MPKDPQKTQTESTKKALRVRLGGGPYVRPDVHEKFDYWTSRGLSYGRVIDMLVDLAEDAKFDPTAEPAKD